MTPPLPPPAERDRSPGPAPAPDVAASDAEAAARLRAGDVDAFEALFRAHYPDLCSAAYRILGSQAEAEEVVQDVLGRVWERRGQGDLREGLARYCHRSVRNEAINRLRRRQREVAWIERAAVTREDESTPAVPRAVDDRLVDDEMLAAVGRAVEALPERCRLVFELKWRRGLRYAEIADALDIAEKTVENQLLKAIKAIRLALGDLLDS